MQLQLLPVPHRVASYSPIATSGSLVSVELAGVVQLTSSSYISRKSVEP